MPESLWSATLLKKRLALVFSSEFCEIFKNTFFLHDVQLFLCIAFIALTSYKHCLLENFQNLKYTEDKPKNYDAYLKNKCILDCL